MTEYKVNPKHQTFLEQEKLKEEYKKLNPIQEFLESMGIKVWREVVPDDCKDWDYPYRVDMIFEIEGYGLVGIEGKNINTHGQGGIYAQAYLQIKDKYKDKSYFNGKRIRRWCVVGVTDSDMGGERVVVFVKHFFNKLGISYFEYHKTGWDEYINIDSLTQHRIFISRRDGVSGDIDKDCSIDYGRLIK